MFDIDHHCSNRKEEVMEHSRFGYSAVNDFKSCPYKYDLTWNKNLEVIPSDDPTNALYIGTALHKAIETTFEEAQKEYFDLFPVITDKHITEMMNVEIQSAKVKKMIGDVNVFHETRIESCDFIGTIDLLEDLGNGHFNMYDFKYTSNPSGYKDSPQLTIYKHFFELTHPDCRIDKMYFIIVPKSSLKQKDTEDIQQFRRRLMDDLKDPIIIPSEYDQDKLHDFFIKVEEIKHTKVFPKTQNKFCPWCKYNDYCMKGGSFMILPSTDRRQVTTPTRRKIWIYGATMSGKTTVVDSAPNPLNLNTDGNIQFVTMPYVSIKNDVKVEGRLTKTTLAWEIFKESITELEKKQNDFKTLVVDLLEDTYEHCRLYMYDKMDIQHESDDSYRAWDKVRTEFLSTIRRLMNLDYENIILLSHEDMTKDITKKTGDKVTSIKPNIPEKVANKIAGMVDIVARVVVEDDGTRTLNFKSNEVIFGGGRLKGIKNAQIPLDWDALMSVYVDTENTVRSDYEATQKPSRRSTNAKVKEEPNEEVHMLDIGEDDLPFEIIDDEPTQEEPTPDAQHEPVQEETPRRRRRT